MVTTNIYRTIHDDQCSDQKQTYVISEQNKHTIETIQFEVQHESRNSDTQTTQSNKLNNKPNNHETMIINKVLSVTLE
jgi:hypothetical protein